MPPRFLEEQLVGEMQLETASRTVEPREVPAGRGMHPAVAPGPSYCRRSAPVPRACRRSPPVAVIVAGLGGVQADSVQL